MRRWAGIAAGLVLGAGLLSGCGGDDGDAKATRDVKAAGSDYCDTLKSAAETVKSFSGTGGTPDFAKFDEFIDAADDLAERAPREVADEWKVIVDGLDELTAVLDEAGLTIAEVLTALTTGKEPAGVDQAELMALVPKLQKLDSEGMDEATDAIDKHAKAECGVELSVTN